MFKNKLVFEEEISGNNGYVSQEEDTSDIAESVESSEEQISNSRDSDEEREEDLQFSMDEMKPRLTQSLDSFPASLFNHLNRSRSQEIAVPKSNNHHFLSQGDEKAISLTHHNTQSVFTYKDKDGRSIAMPNDLPEAPPVFGTAPEVRDQNKQKWMRFHRGEDNQNRVSNVSDESKPAATLVSWRKTGVNTRK